MQSMAMLWVSMVLIAGASGASAQNMYRCGSIYQDRPCTSGTPDKVMRSSAADAPTASTARPTVDPYCLKRGVDAQNIVWARESGKTAEDLSRQAQSDQQRQLIAEVYAQRGTAPQVRDAITAQCQRDRDLLGPGFMPFNTQGGNGYTPDNRPQDNSAATRDNSPPKATNTSNYNPCDSLKSQLETVRNLERQGGNAQVMESLKQRHNGLEQAARAQGC